VICLQQLARLLLKIGPLTVVEMVWFVLLQATLAAPAEASSVARDVRRRHGIDRIGPFSEPSRLQRCFALMTSLLDQMLFSLTAAVTIVAAPLPARRIKIQRVTTARAADDGQSPSLFSFAEQPPQLSRFSESKRF
jgi:hypothetical protein